MNHIAARLLASAAAIALAAPAFAQDAETGDDIVVTAQRDNQTQVERGGSVGVLGNKSTEDVPFAIKSYSETLILNQQPQTLGQVLETIPRFVPAMPSATPPNCSSSAAFPCSATISRSTGCTASPRAS